VDLAVPSRYVDASRVRFVGPDHPGELRVRVLLPERYDPTHRYPVLYLLHGFGEAYDTWSRTTDPRAIGGMGGDVATATGDLQALVVMPEGADAWYTDWWNEGRRGDPQWGRWLTEEVVPAVDARFRTKAGRRNRAVGGFSMGGFGALHLAARRPDLFGTALSFSGGVSLSRSLTFPATPVVDDRTEEVFGPRFGFYRAGLDPIEHLEALRDTRLWQSYGDGVPAADDTADAVALGVPLELSLLAANEEFRERAGALGVPIAGGLRRGIHSYRYIRQDLVAAIQWGLFAEVPKLPTSWQHRTVLPQGKAWDVRYDFGSAGPHEVIRFVRSPGRLQGEGTGTVRLKAGKRPWVEVQLPIDLQWPP
ncbi:MAG: esterase family protein, partial [Actinobacteria bacterium]|nr:esterase family protein [Actinomycetota bacterium]